MARDVIDLNAVGGVFIAGGGGMLCFAPDRWYLALIAIVIGVGLIILDHTLYD